MGNAALTHTHTQVSVVRNAEVVTADTNTNSSTEDQMDKQKVHLSLYNVSNEVISWTCSNRTIKDKSQKT